MSPTLCCLFFCLFLKRVMTFSTVAMSVVVMVMEIFFYFLYWAHAEDQTETFDSELTSNECNDAWKYRQWQVQHLKRNLQKGKNETLVFSPNQRWLKWHHMRPFFRLYSAPSKATQCFIQLFHIYGRTPQILQTDLDLLNWHLIQFLPLDADTDSL